MIRLETGKTTVTTDFGTDNLAESIKEAISFPNPEKTQDDSNSKLQLAIELYSSYFFEKSREAKFIKLVTVLEALIPECKVSETSQLVIDKLKKNIIIHRDKHDQDSDERQELERLSDRI